MGSLAMTQDSAGNDRGEFDSAVAVLLLCVSSLFVD